MSAKTETQSSVRQLGIDSVPRDRVGERADADEAGRELVEVGLADHQSAGLFQQADDSRVVFRQVGIVREAAVVGMPATSILSFTAIGMPKSGFAGSNVPSFAASAKTVSFSTG
ncbi:hypothetical protein ACVJBD_006188 [Rhizobium mongolense]